MDASALYLCCFVATCKMRRAAQALVPRLFSQGAQVQQAAPALASQYSSIVENLAAVQQERDQRVPSAQSFIKRCEC